MASFTPPGFPSGHVVGDMEPEDVLSVYIGVKLLALSVISKESLLRSEMSIPPPTTPFKAEKSLAQVDVLARPTRK